MTCDNPGNNLDTGDYSCFYGEGICMKQVLYRPLFQTKDGSAHAPSNGMDAYEIAYVPFNVGCSCQIIQGSYFQTFI